MSHNQLERLDKSIKYKIKIDSVLDEKGSMTISDFVLKGKSNKEVLLTTYICHPSPFLNLFPC